MAATKKTLVIRNGTLIDGSGKAAGPQRRHRHRGQPHQERRRAAAATFSSKTAATSRCSTPAANGSCPA